MPAASWSTLVVVETQDRALTLASACALGADDDQSRTRVAGDVDDGQVGAVGSAGCGHGYAGGLDPRSGLLELALDLLLELVPHLLDAELWTSKSHPGAVAVPGRT